MNEEYINRAVFYAKKQLDNDALFECAVLLTPAHAVHRYAYSFTVCTGGEMRTAKAWVNDFDTAERIFDRIVCDKPSAWALEGFVKRLIL